MKTIKGTVTSTKMKNTVVVRVDRQWRHPLYQKTVKRSKKYLVHDESGVKEGDVVTIVETRPMSKLKRWKIVSAEQKTKDKKQEEKQ